MATPDPVPHDYIDAEFMVEGLSSPTDEQKLLQAFTDREGVQSAVLSRGTLSLKYEPVFIHKTQIVEAINRAGFRVAGVESALDSPIDDAIFEEGPPAPVNPPQP